ncbi:helix-turn-helix domain-containing protein [Paenibacillus cremeus]|uniref:Helix-turn-helix transcriptional regulator n=1 Tax=Paenibacillus cremeus TaxID=2163881 RepID=A0A559K4L9_9BACL|nr:helix-turn-helix transcriptional regulator [Paenibacillus cremeus]TVY07047.1 helix-turn-helix transcriptional regulator [Paenibacillus cremeus]
MNEEEIYKTVGFRIRQARIAKNMTQDELCEILRLSRASISNIEVGRHRIQLHVLYQLAETFGMNIRELLV